MPILLIALLPFLAVAPVWWVGRRSRGASALVAALPPIVGLALLGGLLGDVLAGETLVASWPWLDGVGLDLAFRLDGLGAVFALLILGIGLCVVVYAYYYLGPDDPIGPFYAMLMTFMGAMLGIVLAENLLLLVIFWELTSVSSFLLIGYWRHLPAARQGARLALAVTGGGGLALLAGVLLIGHVAGSYDLSVVLASGPAILAHDLYPLLLVLVLLGAFTKSAQFPFHFWLPNAMTAPTPVSAYLHSATMVKAGVFLLARLHPALSGGDLWFFIVTGVGLTTMVFAAYTALFKHDLKGLLAYSTVSHLGLITALFGFSTPLAAVIGVFHIMNHAVFKASLFMTAGIVDHETGTRDARVLGGLRRSMPLTFVVGLIGAMAMAGVPLLNGFLSKEMFFEEAVHVADGAYLAGASWAIVLPILVTLGGLFSVAYSVRFVADVFLGRERHDLPKHPHDPPAGMLLPVAALVALAVAVGVIPVVVIGPLLASAGDAVTGGALPEYSLALWHGLTPALLMTVIAFIGGGLLFWRWRTLDRLHARLPRLDGKRIFERAIDACAGRARAFTEAFDNGSLQRYMALTIGFALLAGALGFFGATTAQGPAPQPVTSEASAPAFVLWAILLTASILTVYYHRNRILSVVLLSVVGLLVSVTFIYFSAPDLGLTQISVEVVTILLILLALYVLPQGTPVESSGLRKLRDALIAIAAGVGVAAIAYAVFTSPPDTIADYYTESSKTLGGGTNVVNVILVDFRGFDTMGEISVLVLAALGVLSMLAGKRWSSGDELQPLTEDRFPTMLTSVTRPLMSLILLMAVYIFLRGHNMPGGGFIAGLVAVVAIIIQYVASGIDWTDKRLTLDFTRLAGAGVLIAVATGVASWLFGEPFLKSAFTHVHAPLIGEFEIASAMAFDVGVFLVVVGALMVMLKRLAHSQRSDEVQASIRDQR